MRARTARPKATTPASARPLPKVSFPVEGSVGYQIRVTHRMLQRYRQVLVSPHGVTAGMWYFLRVLWTEDGLTILGPTQDLIDYCDRIEHWNNSSYVLRLDYGGRRVILPGDAEKPAWDSIEADLDDADLACDILKAAHHGRESGYSETAVDAMDPDFVICSVGKKPSTDASDEYRRHGAIVLSTRHNGTIIVQIWADGEIWIEDHNGERLHSLPPLGPTAA